MTKLSKREVGLDWGLPCRGYGVMHDKEGLTLLVPCAEPKQRLQHLASLDAAIPQQRSPQAISTDLGHPVAQGLPPPAEWPVSAGGASSRKGISPLMHRALKSCNLS